MCTDMRMNIDGIYLVVRYEALWTKKDHVY